MSLDVLRALQLADSAFPSGAFAYSWGLERASECGHVTGATFEAWLLAELVDRWGAFDRAILSDAFDAEDPHTVDADTDLLFMVEPLRLKSAEAGQIFLSAMARLGDPVATRFRDAVLVGATAGHLPVAQGAVYRSMGLGLDLALCASAHAAAQGLASAAVRLGLVGALKAQRVLLNLQPEIAPLTKPPSPDALPASFAPISEIAMMQPADGRLFAN